MSDKQEETPRFAPKCIWCNAEWSDENVNIYSWSGSCDTCDYGSGAELTITCHSCQREMYRKETGY